MKKEGVAGQIEFAGSHWQPGLLTKFLSRRPKFLGGGREGGEIDMNAFAREKAEES